MNKKMLLICGIVACLSLSGYGLYIMNNSQKVTSEEVVVPEVAQSGFENENIDTDSKEVLSDVSEEKTVVERISEKKESVIKKSESNKKLEVSITQDEHINNVPVKKVNLYSQNSHIPFSAIDALSEVSKTVAQSVDKITELNNLYYMGKNNENVLIIVGTSGAERYARHEIEFVEINSAGKPKIIPFGVHAVNDTDDGGEWVFDEIVKRPIKHVKRNSKGVVEYTEIWNYSPEEEIKYELKDKDGKVLTLKKEILNGNENLRTEHLIYDAQGNLKINVSANYEGPNLTRFTYFDADNQNNGVVLINEFNEYGLKTKETVYSPDYKLKNSYKAEYKNGVRTNIKVLDNGEVTEILSAE